MGVYKCYNRLVLLTKAKKGGTMIATVIICIIIAIAVVFAARRAVRTFSGDGSCCGGKRTKKVKRGRGKLSVCDGCVDRRYDVREMLRRG